MNKDFILFNLTEAKEELDRIIQEFETQDEYSYGEFVVHITHLYHHINTAWNARDASSKETEKCSQADFECWRQFPPSEEIHLG